MPFTESRCPACLRAVQSATAPPMESLTLLGIDYVPGDGAQNVKSRHYACTNCLATWKSTSRPREAGDPINPQTWELIDDHD